MPQTPDSGDTAPTPYIPPAAVVPPEISAPSDPILRSTEYRRTTKKVTRRPNKSVSRPTLPETKTVLASLVTAVSGQEYVKVKAQEVRFEQSTGLYILDPYGVIFDDDQVPFGAEPSILVNAVAGIGAPTGPPQISDVFTAVPDDDGGWTGVSGGGGGTVVSLLKITSALTISTYKVDVLDNATDQNIVQSDITLHLAGNTRSRLPVGVPLIGLKQDDGSYVAQQSLIY